MVGSKRSTTDAFFDIMEECHVILALAQSAGALIEHSTHYESDVRLQNAKRILSILEEKADRLANFTDDARVSKNRQQQEVLNG